MSMNAARRGIIPRRVSRNGGDLAQGYGVRSARKSWKAMRVAPGAVVFGFRHLFLEKIRVAGWKLDSAVHVDEHDAFLVDGGVGLPVADEGHVAHAAGVA